MVNVSKKQKLIIRVGRFRASKPPCQTISTANNHIHNTTWEKPVKTTLSTSVYGGLLARNQTALRVKTDNINPVFMSTIK
jgi:hypothetical protein